jgi:hypothetical protein
LEAHHPLLLLNQRTKPNGQQRKRRKAGKGTFKGWRIPNGLLTLLAFRTQKPFLNPARTDTLVLHHWVKQSEQDDGKEKELSSLFETLTFVL